MKILLQLIVTIVIIVAVSALVGCAGTHPECSPVDRDYCVRV